MWDPKDPESMYFIKGHTDVVTSLCFIYGTKFAIEIKLWKYGNKLLNLLKCYYYFDN